MSQFELAVPSTTPAAPTYDPTPFGNTPAQPEAQHGPGTHGIGAVPFSVQQTHDELVPRVYNMKPGDTNILTREVEAITLVSDPIESVWDGLEGTPQSLFLVAIVCMVAACVIYFVEKRGGRM